MSADPAAGMRADARRNRARIVAAAQEAFAAEGLSVPLDEIARRAGVGAGTVYRHFPTKEALFETVVFGRVTAIGERISRWAEDAEPGPAFFTMIEALVEQGAMKRDLVDALTVAGVDISDRLAQARDGIRGSMAVLLARAQAAGAVRTDVTVEDLATLLGTVFLAAQQQGQDIPRTALAVIADGLRT
ncbi:MAG TPA: TetR/AcrR family transcriptional regulator [Pseudonocardiaceae bacterium]|jgi:AcrR family transcriptional regulator|nr:TetR/AcrR family transcriptional regulator [Pseudonocardiaceae bacterium]